MYDDSDRCPTWWIMLSPFHLMSVHVKVWTVEREDIISIHPSPSLHSVDLELGIALCNSKGWSKLFSHRVWLFWLPVPMQSQDPLLKLCYMLSSNNFPMVVVGNQWGNHFKPIFRLYSSLYSQRGLSFCQRNIHIHI